MFDGKEQPEEIRIWDRKLNVNVKCPCGLTSLSHRSRIPRSKKNNFHVHTRLDSSTYSIATFGRGRSFRILSCGHPLGRSTTNLDSSSHSPGSGKLRRKRYRHYPRKRTPEMKSILLKLIKLEREIVDD